MAAGPPPDESLPRWQGKVDAHMETSEKQIETLFRIADLEEKARQLEHDELHKKFVELSTKFSNLVARLAVIVAIGSFVGTVVTSLFVAAIIKIFLK